jgi:hypothetical protein
VSTVETAEDRTPLTTRTVVRRGVPWLVLPLALIATGFASAPWLRAFPSSVISTPLFGAAIVSFLIPVLAVRLGARWLWLTALLDVAVFLLYGLLVVLREPTNLGDLGRGLVQGPAQILSFALPLVSPRTLLVAPVALCWFTGALAGECVARRWYTLLPYTGWLVCFGLSYAGTVRGAVANAHDDRLYDTLLASALLLTMMLLRVAQTWVRQDESAQTTQVDSTLPLRGLVIGVAVALAVGLIAAAAAQSPTFTKRTSTPQRVPSVNQSQPLTPLSFVAGLRPDDPKSPGVPAFSVQVNRNSPNYFDLADVDYYDGNGWSFTRTFRPSGGVVPADTDPSLATGADAVNQEYTVQGTALTDAPWMPSLYRPQKVTGIEVNVDAESGMVVPTNGLSRGQSYAVRSLPSIASFARLGSSAQAATSPPPIDIAVPGPLRATLGELITAFGQETGTSPDQPIPFLQAVLADLHNHYALASGAGGVAPASSSSPAASSSSPASSASAANTQHTGGLSFADVQASILGINRAATPEQYATLFAMLARQLGVPARVVTGFRVPLGANATTLAPGTYNVTTADAWTWVEIPIRDNGWVVVDPSPGTYGTGAQQSVGAETSPSPSSAPASQNALVTQTNAGHAVAPKSPVPHKRPAAKTPLVIVAALIVAGFVVFVLALLLLRKRLRLARRRRTANARARLLGAWRESLDMLTEAGLPELSTLTTAEVAAATKEQFGSESAALAASIGNVANAVVFSTTMKVQPADADGAWQHHSDLRKLVRRRLPFRSRVVAGLRYHRSPPRKPVIGPTSWAAAARATAKKDRRRRQYRGRRRSH